MKQLLISFLLAPLFPVAQDCKSYYMMSNNSVIEMTIFDKKGNESGRQIWNITDVKKNGTSFESQVNGRFVNEKGKELNSSKGAYKCDGGVLRADVRLSMPQEQMQAYNTMRQNLTMPTSSILQKWPRARHLPTSISKWM